jgi:5-methyltetrahydropteroyltriglutamate--homocysteine methyltransferase
VVHSDRAPFRADHVGSLLRPAQLHQARERAQAGAISRGELREVEDRCIRDVVAAQEAVGLRSVTDGEFRRTLWHTDFLCGFAGIGMTQSDYAVTFKGESGETAGTSSMMAVNGKVRRERPIMIDHFAFLKAATRRTPKLSTMFPSPPCAMRPCASRYGATAKTRIGYPRSTPASSTRSSRAGRRPCG